jgi:predicted extracellular nuclease
MKIKWLIPVTAGVFLCLSGLAQIAAAVSTDPLINEFSASTTGADIEYIEVLGDPGTDYSAFTVLEIEGDSSTGRIDRIFPVGTTDGGGFWTTSVGSLSIENGSITLLLVEGFVGSVGNDIDADNDGVVDSAPWSRIVDEIAVFDGGSGDLTYSSVVLGPNFDGLSSFSPGGASRIPNGADTDTIGDWVRNDFNLFGIPGFAGSPELGEAENTPGAVNMAITVETDPIGVCGDPATFIHDIQGAGLASVDVGNIREIEGVVVGDFQGSAALNGFFVQEEDAEADADPLTSEGIFVFDPVNAVALDTGDVVRVRGAVAEFSGLTQINNVAAVIYCNIADTASATTLTLPVAAVTDFEATEGMAINFTQTLFASGNFNQGRFGEVDLSVGGALDNPTNVAAPGAAANAVRDLNNRSRIQLDDGSNIQNPLPLPPYIGFGGTLRTGDSVAVVMGVLSESFGSYEVHPTTAVNFTRVNSRTAPPNVGGSLTVSAYNVLNYFTTLDNAGAICGPDANQGCRGADNAFEFGQQKVKLVSAISKVDADVVGIMEIENAAGDGPTADLVSGINAATAAGTYDYVATGAIGTDAIRVALLYKPAVVTPLGAFAVLDSSVNPLFNDTRNRPVLAQSFVENATGAVFTVAVNHLKSKGSSCADIGDPNIGDEQGNCNLTRTAAAQAEVDWLATDPTGSGSGNFLITGDLNAYAQEDPVTTIEGAGYTDLIESFVGSGFSAGAYSFNFFSESGYLDHGLASASLTPQVAGAAFWHVNADEPRALDYNNFNQPELFNPDEFRSSDHDPVIIGLALNATVSNIIRYFDAAVAAGTISGAEKEKSRKSGKSGKSDKSKKSKKSMKSGKSGKSGKDRGDKEVEKVRKHLVKAEQDELNGDQGGACKNIAKAQKHFRDGKLEGDDAIVVETMIANYLAANCPA